MESSVVAAVAASSPSAFSPSSTHKNGIGQGVRFNGIQPAIKLLCNLKHGTTKTLGLRQLIGLKKHWLHKSAFMMRHGLITKIVILAG